MINMEKFLKNYTINDVSEVVEKIKKSYSFVDLVFGTHNIFKFAELVYTSFKSDSMIIDIWKDTEIF